VVGMPLYNSVSAVGGFVGPYMAGEGCCCCWAEGVHCWGPGMGMHLARTAGRLSTWGVRQVVQSCGVQAHSL
jgi:hypothetical protein